MVAGRSHLSIGEVLNLLQSDFPEVTISKIRFLEAQGLLDPERTPSGYRKFYEADVRRLRWILTEQRDRFLPLRVIKDRLADGADPDAGSNTDAASEGSAGPTVDMVDPGAQAAPADPTDTEARRSDAVGVETDEVAVPDTTPADSTQADTNPADRDTTHPGADGATEPIWMADAAKARSEADSPRSTSADVVALMSDPSTVSLTLDELAAAAGATRAQIESLQEFGLLAGQEVGRDRYYDGDDLVIAQKAAGFLHRGLEARHLRTFKTAAEREASLIQQLVLPLVKQRSAEGRDEAHAAVGELALMGQALRAALLRAAMRDANLI